MARGQQGLNAAIAILDGGRAAELRSQAAAPVLAENARVDAAIDRVARRVELGRQRRQAARQAAPEARHPVIAADLEHRGMVGTISETAGIERIDITDSPPPR